MVAWGLSGGKVREGGRRAGKWKGAGRTDDDVDSFRVSGQDLVLRFNGDLVMSNR